HKLTLCSKLCFAIGGAPKEVAASATAFFLQIYLLDVAQINPFQASMVLFIGKAWGAVTDPIVGFFITKTRWTKIGRLMPWMVGCSPFLVVSYFYLWFVPPFVSTGRFIWYLGFYCLYQTLITCFHVPYSALTMFLSTDQKERDSATAYRMTMEVFGTLVGAAIQGPDSGQRAHSALPASQRDDGLLLLHACPLSLLQKEVYMIAAGVIGGVFLICTLVMFLGVRERDGESLSGLKIEETDTAFGYVRFLLYTDDVSHSCLIVCAYVNLTKTRHMFAQVSAVISIPVWQWFLQKFGKKTAAFCGITWIMPFTLMLVFIPNVVVAYVVAVSSGLSVAASLLLPWSMLPDVVDDFRLANPYCKGHEAIFYSFYVFFTKFAAGISLGVSTLCLEFAGYNTGACKQPAPVVYTLKLLIGAAPVAFIVTGLMILLLYPISEDVRLRNRLCLDELR
uniref:MFSD2 lysolipid transporter B, sphingolipid n=1 Tax=Gasterosteus aculeatus aculeatus TaxID=481459 RepID=A0AAQ4REE1_GASAC